ncbi:MAG: hypothetical protein QMC90_02270 [Dehalococcoidales bacterium]|nr:hypothetical protein [Dehalococcoidales bacterium]
MAGKKFKCVEFERQEGERFDILRFSLRVPKLGLPKETGKHLRSAESEMLLAARTIIDELVERLAQLGTKKVPTKGEGEEPPKQKLQ